MSVAMRLESWAVAALLGLLSRLSPEAASNLAGGIAGVVGPLLPVSRVADANLRFAMPELDAAARRDVVRRSWSELGRTAGELPHLGRLPRGAGRRPGWTVEGEEHLATLAHGGGPAIFVTGHIGNWEVLPLASIACGVPVASFYRAAKNEGVDAIVAKFRQRAAGPDIKLFRKGAQGARQAMLHLRQGGFLGMLVDQKLNDGVEARLFGRPAMTAPAAAAFALHFRCPVIPILCRRIGPARLHVVVEPPVDVPLTGERAADILAVTQRINDRLETWIRDDPGSWLWMHRRWPKQLAPE